MPTLRDWIKEGRRGGFAKALLDYYEHPVMENLMQAYCVADDDNRAALERAMLPVSLVRLHEAWLLLRGTDLCGAAAIEREFAGLTQLDEETDDPRAIVLRTEAVT